MVFIGGINIGNQPRGGEEAKNQRLVSYFKTNGYNVKIFDTSNWKQNKIRTIVYLFKIIVIDKEDKVLISCATPSAYKLLQLFNLIRVRKRKLFYIVIGGTLSEKIKNKEYRYQPFKKVNKIFVETKAMKNELTDVCGFENVEYLPNFRSVPLFEEKKNLEEKVKFVFVSRIIPTKGCNLIFESVQILNNKKLKKAFDVSFYGPIEESYKSEFFGKIRNFSNIKYEGYLNLQEKEGYETLSSYDILLFPTFHKGEGFPGILIDAFIAGVSIIATDWNFNKEILEDKSIIIKPNNVNELIFAMENIIESDKSVIQRMSVESKKRAKEFDQNVVLKKLEKSLIGC